MGLTPAPLDELPVGLTVLSLPAKWAVSNELRLAEPTEGEEGAEVGCALEETERKLRRKLKGLLLVVEVVWVLDGGGE